MEIIHRHGWTYYDGSGFGRAYKLRHCDCGRYETYMFDISKCKLVWVEGNFFEDINSPIFIVAETSEAYEEIANQLPKETNKLWVKDSVHLEKMKEYRNPRFVPARDWKDTALSDRDEFRLLMATGHL